MASKTKNVTTTSTATPFEPQQPFLQDVWGQAQNLYGQRPQLGDVSQSYINASDAFNTAASSPLLGQARDYYSSVARGDYLRPDSNPFFNQMVDQTIQAARPSVDSAFAGSGRLGSGAHAAAFSDAALRASTGLGYQNYVTERGYQDQANGMLPQVAAMPGGFLQQAADLRNTGATLQPNADWAALNNYRTAIGSPIIANQTGSQPIQQANPIMQGVGAATGILGGIGSLFGPFKFSDARVKEDITPVGRLDNGLTVYSYRYRGSPQTEVGLLAQEVAMTKPEAVAHMGGGLLGVDYAEASR